MPDGKDNSPGFDAAKAAETIPCWSCSGSVDGRVPFCHSCGVIQPPRPADDFQRLGLSGEFDVDPKEIEKRYFAFQRTFHPDRFTGKSPREQQYSLQHSTGLNESYERLKKPLSRAIALLAAKGLEPADGATTERNPELLMEAMESHEALAAAETDEEIAALEAIARLDIEINEEALSVAFSHEDLGGASQIISRMKYLVKLLEEIRQKRRRVQTK